MLPTRGCASRRASAAENGAWAIVASGQGTKLLRAVGSDAVDVNLSHRDKAGTPTVEHRDSTVPVPSRPVPSHTNAQPTVAREPSKFPDWWAIWGKKKAKGDAHACRAVKCAGATSDPESEVPPV